MRNGDCLPMRKNCLLISLGPRYTLGDHPLLPKESAKCLAIGGHGTSQPEGPLMNPESQKGFLCIWCLGSLPG